MKKGILLFTVFVLTSIIGYYTYISYFKIKKTVLISKTNTDVELVDSKSPSTDAVDTSFEIPFKVKGLEFGITFNKFSYVVDSNTLEAEIEILNTDPLDFINLSYAYALRQGDISNNYTLKLPITRLDLIDVKNASETFTISSGKTKMVSLKYKLPPNLNPNKYYLEFQITNNEGKPIASNVYPFEIKNTVGVGMPLLIKDSYILRKNVKTVHNFPIYYGQNEQIGKIVTQIKNPTNSTITVYPSYKIFNYPEKGGVIDSKDESAIVLHAGEDYQLESYINSISRAGVYSIYLHLYSKNKIDQSIIVNYRAITKGRMASYYYIKANKFNFSADINSFFYFLYGKSDNDGLLQNAVLRTSLFDSDILIEQKEVKNIKLGFAATPIMVEYGKHDLLEPIIMFSIFDNENNELFNKTVKIN